MFQFYFRTILRDMRDETLIFHLALYLIFIAMSKTKHPANGAFSRKWTLCSHICPTICVCFVFRLFFIVSSNNELYFKTFRDLQTFGNYVIFTTFNELPMIDILYTY